MSFSPPLLARAEKLLADAREKGLKLATAESCTGGLVAGLLTEIPGSSDVFDRGFVTYSNQAKEEMLGVPGALLRQHGAVSEAVARAMAEGAIRNSVAQLALAITGIARLNGPADVLVCGSAREWETVEYAQDMIAAGVKKGLVLLGENASVQPAMPTCARWIESLVAEVPVTFVPLPEPYWNP